MFKKTKVLQGIALGMAVLMGGVEIAAAKAERVVVWHGYRGKEKEAFEQVVKAFNDANADTIKVKTLAVPFDAYADKITASVPRGRGPDVFIFAQDRLGGWIEAGETIEPIDFFLTDEVKERFLPNTYQAMVYQDTPFGLPLNFKNITLIYNKNLVKEPPKTTGELVKLAKSLTNTDTNQYGLAYEYSNFYYHAALMNAFGGKVFEAGPKSVVANEDNLKSIKLMLKWFNEDKIMPKEPSAGLITNLFSSDKAAMVFSGPWFLSELDKSSVNYGIATLPTVDEAGGKPMSPWMTVEGVYISAQSKNKELAYKLVEYVTSTDAGKVMATVGRQTPANKAVYDLPEVKADEELQAFRRQVETAQPMPNLAEMSMFWSPATTAMNKIVKGTSSPEDALGEAQAAIQKSVEELRK